MNIVPQIRAPQPLQEWLKTELPESRLVLAPNKENRDPLENISNNLALLIGPEGGLSEQEIAEANDSGFKNWCIGNRVLRTETAPVVALSILNHIIVK